MKTRSLLVFLGIAVSLVASSRGATETYVADPAHSSVTFTIRHVFSEVPGRFTKFNAIIKADRANLENSTVEATIEVPSVDTTEPKRDAHLQKPEFFDAAKYPTMTFKSTTWSKTGEDTFDVTGSLTIKGVTKQVVLKAQSLGFGPGMVPGTTVSGWKVTAKLNRNDFGVSAFPKVLGEDVNVTINIEADLQK